MAALIWKILLVCNAWFFVSARGNISLTASYVQARQMITIQVTVYFPDDLFIQDRNFQRNLRSSQTGMPFQNVYSGLNSSNINSEHTHRNNQVETSHNVRTISADSHSPYSSVTADAVNEILSGDHETPVSQQISADRNSQSLTEDNNDQSADNVNLRTDSTSALSVANLNATNDISNSSSSNHANGNYATITNTDDVTTGRSRSLLHSLAIEDSVNGNANTDRTQDNQSDSVNIYSEPDDSEAALNATQDISSFTKPTDNYYNVLTDASSLPYSFASADSASGKVNTESSNNKSDTMNPYSKLHQKATKTKNPYDVLLDSDENLNRNSSLPDAVNSSGSTNQMQEYSFAQPTVNMSSSLQTDNNCDAESTETKPSSNSLVNATNVSEMEKDYTQSPDSVVLKQTNPYFELEKEDD